MMRPGTRVYRVRTRDHVAELQRRVEEGKSLRAWIASTGRKLGELADEIGVGKPTVSNWIRGDLPISAERREQLRALGWSPDASGKKFAEGAAASDNNPDMSGDRNGR